MALPGWLGASWGALGCSDASYVIRDRSADVGSIPLALRRGRLWSRSSVGPTGPLLMYAHASGSGASPLSLLRFQPKMIHKRDTGNADVILCKDGYSAALLAHVTTTYDE